MGNNTTKPTQRTSHDPGNSLTRLESDSLEKYIKADGMEEGQPKPFDRYLRKYLLQESKHSNSIPQDKFVQLLRGNRVEQDGCAYELSNIDERPLLEFVKAVCERGLACWLNTSNAHTQIQITDSIVKELAIYIVQNPDSVDSIYKSLGKTNDYDVFLNEEEAESKRDKLVIEWMDMATAAGKIPRNLWSVWWRNNKPFQELIHIACQSLVVRPSSSNEQVLSSTSTISINEEGHQCPYLYRSPGVKTSPILPVHLAWAVCQELPTECRKKWSCLYSSKENGKSWNAFQNSIESKGAILLLVKEKLKSDPEPSKAQPQARIFGAYIDSDLDKAPSWYGNSLNFLFVFRPFNASTLTESAYIPLSLYRSTGFNENYQYFNYGTKTLPNGLGVGGQLDHFGLWIDESFMSGHSNSAATFASKQLSTTRDFDIDSVEAWLVRSTTRNLYDLDTSSPKKSALDTNPDAVALLEVANKTMYSKMVREPNIDDNNDK